MQIYIYNINMRSGNLLRGNKLAFTMIKTSDHNN